MALSIERVEGGGAVLRITVPESRVVFFETLASEPQGPGGGQKFTTEGARDFVLQKIMQDANEQMNTAVNAHRQKDADLDKAVEAQKAELDKNAAKLKAGRPELIGFAVADVVTDEVIAEGGKG